MSKRTFDLEPPYVYQYLVKIIVISFIVIPFVVFEILGGVSKQPDADKLSEKADAINR